MERTLALHLTDSPAVATGNPHRTDPLTLLPSTFRACLLSGALTLGALLIARHIATLLICFSILLLTSRNRKSFRLRFTFLLQKILIDFPLKASVGFYLVVAIHFV